MQSPGDETDNKVLLHSPINAKKTREFTSHQDESCGEVSKPPGISILKPKLRLKQLLSSNGNSL